MKCSALFLLPLLICLTVSPTVTEAQPGFRIGVDLARFRGDTARVYLEVYYTFDVSKLKFAKTDSILKAEALMDIYFKRSSNDSIVARQTWRIPFTTNDSTLLATSRSYSDVLGFLLAPDVYRMYVVGGGNNSWAKRDSFSVPIDLRPIESAHISLSDIELCTSIVSVGKDSVGRFIKNTYEVKPNPSKIYGGDQSAVYYYIETYNLLKNSSPYYYTRLTVTNSIGKEVITRSRIKNRVNESNVEVGAFQVNALRTGAYTVNFTVIDSVDNSNYTSSKKIFVYNPQLPMDSLTAGTEGSVLASEYATMTESELDLEFSQLKYIMSRAEQAEYKNVKGIDAKRKVLYEFWRKRADDLTNPNPLTKTEYFKRVDYANEHFRAGFKDGWKTDRGRVFIVYGPPDEIERHANEVNTKPYEIWTYHSIQGGVEFIFGDRSGFSDYDLLHSTHRDELQNANWMNQLQVQ
ncbi:MAG TPA: GWxTD domain-containing protein [Bacteroidota bacterium]|nr:GWxTD domain-containing protein [Bacteroidota bacterium]